MSDFESKCILQNLTLKANANTKSLRKSYLTEVDNRS